MNPPSTLAVVLRWHSMEFVGGIFIIIASLLGLMNFEPDPPGHAFQSLSDMLGIWPYMLGIAVGVLLAVFAWCSGRALRNGD